MEYRKPELIRMGDATEVIQSSLMKGPRQFDSITGPPALTNVAAYEADE
jgi:hypothetical protein